MSLIIGIRAAEGLVLATDSLIRRGDAVYLTGRKLFTFPEQPYVAVATCGLLSFGAGELRPLPVLMEEFRSGVLQAHRQRLSVAQFAQQLGAFLITHWRETMPEDDTSTTDLVVAGFDDGARHGELYTMQVPNQAEPQLQQLPNQAYFAGYWGHTAGVDKMTDPYTFPFAIMPLADCAALAAHLLTSTAQLEAWSTEPQRIGGLAQVVTITQAEGVRWVWRKAF